MLQAVNFQVLWLGKPNVQVSWVPASSVPPRAISEFEKGLGCEAITEQTNQYGHETSIIFVKDKRNDAPPAKKSRTERPVIPNSDG